MDDRDRRESPSPLWRAGRGKAVHGSAQPARGLSGRLRHRAYRIPEHLARRWWLLVLADRLERLECRLRPSER